MEKELHTKAAAVRERVLVIGLLLEKNAVGRQASTQRHDSKIDFR
jgi:RPA family protein